jgi:hypothetical protein
MPLVRVDMSQGRSPDQIKPLPDHGSTSAVILFRLAFAFRLEALGQRVGRGRVRAIFR